MWTSLRPELGSSVTRFLSSFHETDTLSVPDPVYGASSAARRSRRAVASSPCAELHGNGRRRLLWMREGTAAPRVLLTAVPTPFPPLSHPFVSTYRRSSHQLHTHTHTQARTTSSTILRTRAALRERCVHDARSPAPIRSHHWSVSRPASIHFSIILICKSRSCVAERYTQKSETWMLFELDNCFMVKLLNICIFDQ